MASQQAITDLELVQQFIQGNEIVLEQLLERHKSKIYTSIFILVKDRDLADDVFQDTFIKVIDKLRQKKYDEQGKFLPWVLRIAHNLCMDFYRKEKKMNVYVSYDESFNILDTIADNSVDTEEALLAEERMNLVIRLLDLLPEEQKEVVILKHYYDCSFKEIAQMTNVNIGTALGRMRYALINLRKLMEAKKKRTFKAK